MSETIKKHFDLLHTARKEFIKSEATTVDKDSNEKDDNSCVRFDDYIITERLVEDDITEPMGTSHPDS